MLGGFQAKKLNIHKKFLLSLAPFWAEPENQAELERGPDPDKM